jgi:hypothetical protein
MQTHLFLIIFSAYVALFTAYGSIRTYILNRGSTEIHRFQIFKGSILHLPPRPERGRARSLFIFQAILIVILSIEFARGAWKPGDVGYNNEFAGWVSISAGVVIYFIFLVLFEKTARMLGRLDVIEDASFLALRAAWPRSIREKRLAIVPVFFLNPLTEELIHRGVLIYALGIHIGNFALPVIIGLILNLLMHLYQGPVALISHIFFFAIVISILFSPLGIVGAVGFHFAGDVVPIVTFRKQMLRWVHRHRREQWQREE